MAIRGTSIVEKWRFTSEADDAPEPEKTIFFLGMLDVDLSAEIQDNTTEFFVDGDNLRQHLKIARRNVMYVRFGLKGWERFLDKDGNELPFKTEVITFNNKQYTVATWETINLIPPNIIGELGRAIQSGNEVSGTTRKN